MSSMFGSIVPVLVLINNEEGIFFALSKCNSLKSSSSFTSCSGFFSFSSWTDYFSDGSGGFTSESSFATLSLSITTYSGTTSTTSS